MDKMRAGFIGAGRIADLHAPGYRDPSAGSGQAEDAGLFAVCDADSEVAAHRSAREGRPVALSEMG